MVQRALKFIALGCCLSTLPLCAQTPTPDKPIQPAADAQPQRSPKAAYTDAIRPLDRTRSDVGNWSNTEIAALTVAIARAKVECEARDATKFDGQELIDLAQLCSAGQDFVNVEIAARRYLDADGAKPKAMRAYADLLDAELHLKQEPDALATAQKMLAAVPYERLTTDAIDEAITYMKYVHTADALTLSVAREPLLLAQMKAVQESSSVTASDAETAQSLHELYADGMAFAALEQLAKMPFDDTVKALDAALPAQLAPDDAVEVVASRKRFALLGKPLPKIVAEKFLSMPGTMPGLPAHNAVTGLLLFPDWCVQCVYMGQHLPPTVFTVEGNEAYIFGVLAATVPQLPAMEDRSNLTPNKAFSPAEASNLLRETPTAVVTPEVLNTFTASDVPFLVLTDSTGIVRVLEPVGDDALALGGLIDAAIARIGERWPNPARTRTGAVPGTNH